MGVYLGALIGIPISLAMWGVIAWSVSRVF